MKSFVKIFTFFLISGFAMQVFAQKANERASEGSFGKSALYKQIASTLVETSGNIASAPRLEKLAKSKYVLVYHSAHWCPPCRQFTPKFVQFYEDHQKNASQAFEAIFVSLDNSIEEQKKYMKEAKMPWLAVKYEQARKSELMQFAGRGIPCLVLLDENGSVLANSYHGDQYLGPNHVLKEFEKLLSKH